eukprot:gene13045-biopygen465
MHAPPQSHHSATVEPVSGHSRTTTVTGSGARPRLWCHCNVNWVGTRMALVCGVPTHCSHHPAHALQPPSRPHTAATIPPARSWCKWRGRGGEHVVQEEQSVPLPHAGPEPGNLLHPRRWPLFQPRPPEEVHSAKTARHTGKVVACAAKGLHHTQLCTSHTRHPTQHAVHSRSGASQ